MKVLGIIAEYNPFHNGHLYHINSSKAIYQADAAVCVMSGNFIQRGEPAVADKWARAEMALSSGIDLVLELPVVYAMSSAEFFAYGAVKILDSLGVVDYISFGSEAGSMELLDAAASVLFEEPEEYRELLKAALSRGISFPAARQEALEAYLSASGAAEVLSSSNNILAVEYLKAIKKLSSRMQPVTIQRKQAPYNSEELTGAISSATSIRKLLDSSDIIKNKALFSNTKALLSITMPEASAKILMREIEAGRAPVFPSSFDTILLSALRRMAPEDIRNLPYVSEGLENRITEAAAASGSVNELIDRICTKRFTRTRIQRILFSALAGIASNDIEAFQENGGPCYIRVLGFNDNGRRLLSQIKNKATLPIIMKTADFKKDSNPFVSRMIQLEAAATDQYVLAFEDKGSRNAGQEFTRNVLRV